MASCLTGKVLIRGFQSLDQFFATRSIDNKEQLVEAVKMKPELYSICHLPLNAVILVYLYDMLKDNLPTTRTGLFDPLVRNFLYRHMLTRTTYNPSSIDNLPEDLPADIRESLGKISELAYKSILERKKVIDQRTVIEFGLGDIDNALGFLKVHLRLTMYGASECYSFVHLSLQEYLAALYISQMNDHQQAVAVKTIFGQNPLSPVLTFYAGLTGLTIKQVQNIFFEVLNYPLDSAGIAKKLGLDRCDSSFSVNTAHDQRRHILALINCIYETQDLHLIAYVKLPARGTWDLLVKQSSLKLVSSEGVTRHKNEYVTFRGLPLYPTDCLSIGNFAQHASNHAKHRLYLDFTCCLLGDMGMKALTQELKKPAKKANLELNLGNVHISSNALEYLSQVFHPQSCLVGLSVSGHALEDTQLAMKYFIEGFYKKSRCKSLASSSLYCKLIYHLILLLRCPKLETFALSYSDLFISSTATYLFSESLKFTQLVRLHLFYCAIDDTALMLLTPGVCHKYCTVVILEIDNNPYSDDALVEFLQYILRNEPFSGRLSVLSVNHDGDVHHRLVEMINVIRKKFETFRPPLTLGCMEKLCAKHKEIQAEVEGQKLLYQRSDLNFRSPHH